MSVTYNDEIIGNPVTFPLILNGMMIDYVLEVPIDSDALRTNLYAMVGYSRLAQTILGTGVNNETLAVDLPCAPISPGGLQVVVGVGAIYQYVNYLGVNYGVINADSDPNHELLKQGILFDPVTLNTPAPAGSGNSIIYLIQATYSETATNSVSRPYYDPNNPTNPTYTSQPDTLSAAVSLAVKAGVPASSPTPPTADAGYIPLYYVQVANGQTVIITGNITKATNAPFITESLTQKISQATGDARYAQINSTQSNSYNYAVDSGTTNNYIATISPAPTTYIAGASIFLKIANQNTGASTLTVNSLATKAIKLNSGDALIGNELKVGMIAQLIYDGIQFQLMNPSNSIEIIPGMMFDYSGGSVPSNFLLCDGAAVSRTTYANLFAAIGTTWGNGDGSTTFNLPDSRRRVTVGSGGTGTLELGNVTGDTGGEEIHVQTLSELATHNHGLTNNGFDTGGVPSTTGAWSQSSDTFPGGATTFPALAAGGTINGLATTNNNGSSTGFNVIQPSMIVTRIIKY